MKSFILFFALSLSVIMAQAGNAELFQYDKAELSEEMAGLDALEQNVLQNGAVPMLSMNQSPDIDMVAGNLYYLAEGPLGVPSFLWGFCFNIGGVAVVYFVTEDKEQTEKALIGCVVSSLLYGGGYWGFH